MNVRIDPIYSCSQANTEVLLGTGKVQVFAKGQDSWLEGDGRAYLRLSPRCSLVIRSEFPPSMRAFAELAMAPAVSFRFGTMSAAQEAIVLKCSVALNPSQATLDLLPNPSHLMLCSDRRLRVNSVLTHVLNFPNFFSSGQKAEDFRYQSEKNGTIKSQLIGRVILRDEAWEIDLQSLPTTRDLAVQLSREGGHAITHVARLARRDGKSFSISSAEKVLEEMRLFLSFARGQWTTTFGTTGINASGAVVFTDWSVRLAAPWGAERSWFDIQHAECLSDLYPAFVRLIRNPKLGDAVARALYWYLRSNRGGEGAGIDSGVVLSQAALELLADAQLGYRGLSKKGNAAERIRRASVSLNLPIRIPRSVRTLSAARKSGQWTDVPDAIAKIRNELVHPEGRLSVPIARVIIEAWLIAQWYIELFLLSMCSYRGDYSNRLRAGWVGQIERVPWARRR